MRKAVVLIAILFSACGGYKYQKMTEAAAVAQSTFDVTVPFNYSNGLILFTAKIKGRQYTFLFDTGAATTCITSDVANAIGLKPKTEIKVSDSRSQSKKLEVGNIDTLKIGGVDFINQAAIVVNFSENSILACEGVDGIFGITGIRNAFWSIDYSAEVLRFSSVDQDTSAYDFTPLTRANTRPGFSVWVDSVEFTDVLMDLGSNGFADLRKSEAKQKFVEILDTMHHSQKYDGASQGLFGSLLDTVDYITPGYISVGNSIITNPVLKLETDKTPKLGNRFFENYTLYLDFENSRFGLKSEEASIAYPERAVFGFVPFLKDSSFTVVSIYNTSKAYADGMRISDKIQSINGVSTVDLNYDFCEAIAFLSILKEVDSASVVFENEPNVVKTYYKSFL